MFLDDNINEDLIININIDNSPYSYDNRNLPRVTEILLSMLHEDYLMKWSNTLGLYKHTKYETFLDRASLIGTVVHKAIEEYLKENKNLDINTIDKDIRNEVYNAYNSFLEWWVIISNNNYILLLQEEVLTCKYFGGTLDLLIQINGKVYLVDFKTSNHPSYKYTLQASAYRYMLRELGINIDGVIILMLNKNKVKFNEIFYDLSDKTNEEYFKYCEECFMSLVYAYYNRHRIESMFKY